VLEYRDRAILKLYLYSGIRLSTGCRLRVSDFHQDGDEATIRLHEKGDKRRTIGIHFHAAQAIQEYIDKAGLASGPLFRRRLNSRSQKLGRGAITPWTMNALVNRGAPRDFLDIKHVCDEGLVTKELCWELWTRKNPDGVIESAKQNLLLHLKHLEARRPLEQISDLREKESAHAVREWYRTNFLKG